MTRMDTDTKGGFIAQVFRPDQARGNALVDEKW
jgi:hypothetical protein